MATRRTTRSGLLMPVVLVVATWVVTQVGKSLYRRSTAPGTRSQIKARREESTVYSVVLAAALGLTELAVTRLMRERD